MPRSRFDELIGIAEENDGFVTSREARAEGITGSVLSRLAKRKRIHRVARGVYRIPYFPQDRLSQYREAILWAKGSSGPRAAAISHLTALSVYGISDANPQSIHLTIPKAARLRRAKPKRVVLHRASLGHREITEYEGLPLTTIARTIIDLLESGGRIDLVKQAVSDARREGFIRGAEAARLRRIIAKHLKSMASSHASPRNRRA